MGWASAGQIFNPVAQALIDCGASDEMKTTVLAKLINQLQEGDWDTADESLDEFKHDPAIVAAFRQNRVIIECGAGSGSADGSLDCVLEAGHTGEHRDFFGTTWRTEAGA
jgi:hypothetical protein